MRDINEISNRCQSLFYNVDYVVAQSGATIEQVKKDMAYIENELQKSWQELSRLGV